MKKQYFLLFMCLAVLTTISYGQQMESSVTVKDIDGNVYNTVVIGTQVWMKENLKTTKYNDGTPIPNVTDDTLWVNLTTDAYSWYDNDSANKNPYGALYNWYAVETGKLCPTGWHVPSNAEWKTLTDYLGGTNVAGGKLKESGTVHWKSPNSGTTNETGFTALPGGGRNNAGTFNGIMANGNWWSSTESSAANAYTLSMMYPIGFVSKSNSNGPKEIGFSVRCIKD